jgi:hypothetical protein
MPKHGELVVTEHGEQRCVFGTMCQPLATEIQVAKYCFSHYEEAVARGCDVERSELFWFIANYYWGEDSGAKVKFIRHPWSERQIEVACEYQYPAIAGSASSTKSCTFAVFGLVTWLSNPMETKVLVTSTTIRDANRRVWAYVRSYYHGASEPLPGRYVHSASAIRTNQSASDKESNDQAGIELIPAGQSKEAQAIGRLIGIKAKHRLLVIADELPELGHSILEAAKVNLSSNPNFSLVGLGNLGSWVDPFGEFCMPKNGVASVSVEDEGWETQLGYCLHLDGTKSPNFDQDEDLWPCYGRRHQKEHAKLPENSVGFWRFCRSFPCPEGVEDRLYSELEIINGGGMERPHWSGSIIEIATLDPAFTTGGDRCIGMKFALGKTVNGPMTLARTETKEFHEDVTSPLPRNIQLARAFVDWCRKLQIDPRNVGIDETGGGAAFCDIIAQEWSPRIMRIQFGGAPSSSMASMTDGRVAAKKFVNRVSEIWGQGVEYVRAKQLKGFTREIIQELIERRYSLVKGVDAKILVESKGAMKARMRRSPDEADPFLMGIVVARDLHNFQPEAYGAALQTEIAEAQESRQIGSVLEDFECLTAPGGFDL